MASQRRPRQNADFGNASIDLHDFEEEDYGGSASSSRQGQEKLRMLAFELLGKWYWIVAGLVIGLLAAFYVLSKTPKKYTATTVLQIKEQTVGIMGSRQMDDIDMRSLEAMNTVAARIKRMDLMDRVAARQDVRSLEAITPPKVDWMPEWALEKMGKDQMAEPAPTGPPSPEALAGMIASWVQVSIRTGTRLLDISVTHPEPHVSQAVANAVAREYVAELATNRAEGQNSSIEILENGSDEAREKLQTARGSMAIYNRAIEVHGVLDLRETELNALQGRYLPKHPKMIAATAEIKNLQDQFLKEYEISKLAPNEKEYWDGVSDSMPDPETEGEMYLRMARQQLLARVGVLESEIQSATQVFNSMLTRMDESTVDQEAVDTSAEISSLARLPGGPSSPVASTILGMGGAGGLACGLLVALVLVKLDNKYHTVAQFSGETGATVLASISDISTRHLAFAEKKYFKRHPDESSERFKNWDKRILFRPGVSGTNYAEMYRVLRASVSLLGDENKRKVTLFSSALPGEGKTMTSVNFALAAAAQGRRTLLIDLDLRKPAVHKAFGLEREHGQHLGATEYLANQASLGEAIIRDTGVKDFHMILSGKRAPNPGEILSAGRLEQLFEDAEPHYDVIVLDTAPLLAVPDTRIIAAVADNVCIVCRAEYVPKGAVRHLLRTLEEDGTSISGVVFNGFKEKRRLIGENNTYGYYKTSKYGKSYRYGYGAYGAYGSDEN